MRKNKTDLEIYKEKVRNYAIFGIKLNAKYGKDLDFSKDADIGILDKEDWEKILELNIQMKGMAKELKLTQKECDLIDALSGIVVLKEVSKQKLLFKDTVLYLILKKINEFMEERFPVLRTILIHLFRPIGVLIVNAPIFSISIFAGIYTALYFFTNVNRLFVVTVISFWICSVVIALLLTRSKLIEKWVTVL